MGNVYKKAEQPTIYFIGVTTGQSSIMKVFPEWAKVLGLKDAVIKGFDFLPHSPGKLYREAVEFIKNDPLSCGALVTTHKIDLFNTCRDLFDYIDPYAEKLGEVSSISKKDGKLCAHAKDPISSGLALESLIPDNYWKEFDGDVLWMGAGGSSLAMSIYFAQEKFGKNVPKRIIITNRSVPRLESAKKILEGISPKIKFEFIHNPTPEDNDKTLAGLKPHSLVVNATGLGKDAPGSPLTNACEFPRDSLVWEINYRGELLFKEQAEAQKKAKNLHVEDGWVYFIHGWTQVVSEVFHVEIKGKLLEKLSELAKSNQGGNSVMKDLNWDGGFSIDFDTISGTSKTAKTTRRRLSQMREMFWDEKLTEKILETEDPLIYEFYELGCPERAGDLSFGTTILYPGKVGKEYYMTKGHFHTVIDTAEVYYTLDGEGYMVMENQKGDTVELKMEKGQAVYVPRGYAHRTVNTGDRPLILFFAFAADAGHDYGTIETKGYHKMIVEEGGKPMIADNPRWK